MFGKDSTRHRCRWVCDRLPLLDGGELIGSDRRKVESHLIVCPSCRERRAGLAGALNALRAAAVESPWFSNSGDGSDAPSLWPAVQRQIRESRHQPSPSAFGEVLSRLDRPSYRFAALAAMGLIMLTTVRAAVDTWSRSQIMTSNALADAASRPVFVPPAAPHSALDFGANVVNAAPEPSGKSSDRTPSRFGYDLDRGTLSNSADIAQIKPSY